MFNLCSSLKKIKFVSFDSSQVASMESIFSQCSELEYVELSNLNTSNITNMKNMFNKCHKLKEIKDINNFITSKVTNMSSMFNECYELESLDLSNFDTTNVNDMGIMFNKCYKLTYLDLSKFNIKKTKNFESMFNKCCKLKEIKGINNFDVNYLKLNPIITDCMFEGCNELKGCDNLLSILKKKKPYNEYLKELEGDMDNFLDLFQKENDNDDKDSSKEFNNIINNYSEMIIKCTYDIKDNNEIQIINDRNGDDVNGEIQQKIKILEGNQKYNLIFEKKFNNIGLNTITFICEEKLNNMSFMFNQCSSLKMIEFISFDTSQVTNMEFIFSQCIELEYVDLTNFNTSNITDMSFMFNKCHKLKEIQGTNTFDTSNVTSMSYMFNECYEIEYLDLSNFNLLDTRILDNMFNKCYKLKEIKGIEHFDYITLGREEISTECMFNECNELKGCEYLLTTLKNKKTYSQYLKKALKQ